MTVVNGNGLTEATAAPAESRGRPGAGSVAGGGAAQDDAQARSRLARLEPAVGADGAAWWTVGEVRFAGEIRQDDGDGRIRRISKNGGKITTLASRLSDPNVIAVDGTSVYVGVGHADGFIMKITPK